MYLLHAAIVADRLAALVREADNDRLVKAARLNQLQHTNSESRPGLARRLVARVALALSNATARLATWSDPTIRPTSDLVG
jgi:hypothetical protein